MSKYFQYGKKEIDYLSSRCVRMKALIERIGPYQREVTPDVFTALCCSIIGQQISVKAAYTVIDRFKKTVGEVTAENILRRQRKTIQKCGMTMKKVEYLRGVAKAVQAGEIDFTTLNDLTDAEIIAELTQLKGVGVWTVEMLMLFSMQRPNVMSYGDLAICAALRELHELETLTKKEFETYKELYSPYGSTASLYLWALAGEMK